MYYAISTDWLSLAGTRQEPCVILPGYRSFTFFSLNSESGLAWTYWYKKSTWSFRVLIGVLLIGCQGRLFRNSSSVPYTIPESACTVLARGLRTFWYKFNLDSNSDCDRRSERSIPRHPTSSIDWLPPWPVVGYIWKWPSALSMHNLLQHLQNALRLQSTRPCPSTIAATAD